MRVTDIPAADDIAALQQRLAVEPALPYLDVRRAEALDRALVRWPWLNAVRRHADAKTGPA